PIRMEICTEPSAELIQTITERQSRNAHAANHFIRVFDSGNPKLVICLNCTDIRRHYTHVVALVGQNFAKAPAVVLSTANYREVCMRHMKNPHENRASL